MRLSNQVLLIMANPFAAPLSAEGRATALCPLDPSEGGGARYVGAVSKAATVAQPASMRSLFGPRDKVSITYDLRPVRVSDTSYYRNALRSGDVLAAEGAAVKLEGAARASLAAFEAQDGDRSKALAAWRGQGLASIADVIDPPQSAKPVEPPNPDAQNTEGAIS